MELTVWHAVMFIIFACSLLLMMFYLEFYSLATVLYAFGCSGALYQLVFRPIWERVFAGFGRVMSKFSVPTLAAPKFCLSSRSWMEVVSIISGYALGGLWLLVWFRSNDPSRLLFFWVVQDLMGACISVLFLSVLRLTSTKVATILLAAVFVYDIFFVFISPFIFGDNVMVKVATGGGGEWSIDHCEKYPSDNDCRRATLPMVLTIPKINDFNDGLSLLGLGDIVLPGLLIAFTARLDAAKRLVQNHTRLSVRQGPKGGYFPWLLAGYTVALLFAVLAVEWMDRGQPALLYIVPACLGVLLVVGQGELQVLWQGPRVIRWADRIVAFCDSHTFVTRRLDDATAAESLPDDLDDDLDDDESYCDDDGHTDGNNHSEDGVHAAVNRQPLS